MTDPRAPAAKVVVLGWGNPSRGDDALGPELLGRVDAWIGAHPGCGVEAFLDFQLQVEHSLDLEGRDLVLFLDAAVTGPDPYTFRRVEAAPEADPTTHALSPGGLLRAFGALRCGPPPPAYALAVRGHRFELGEAPGPQARLNREAAWSLLERLLETPAAQAWEAWAGAAVPSGADLGFPLPVQPLEAEPVARVGGPGGGDGPTLRIPHEDEPPGQGALGIQGL